MTDRIIRVYKCDRGACPAYHTGTSADNVRVWWCSARSGPRKLTRYRFRLGAKGFPRYCPLEKEK